MAEDKNYCILRNEKLKASSSVWHILAEMLEDEDKKRTSPRADESLSHLNSYSSTLSQAYANFKKLLPGKVRKNAVLACTQVVSTSEEFKSREEEERFYERSRAFLEQKFGKVVAWAIHRDETSTHMQVVTVPLVDGKLNARALIGGSKYKMREIQTSFWEQVGKDFGLERGEEKIKPAKHKTVEEYHTQQKKELDKWIAEFRRELLFDKRAKDIVQKMLDESKLTPKSEPKYLFESLKILSKELTKEKIKNEKLNEFANFEIEKAINILINAKNQGVDSLAEILSGKKNLNKNLNAEKKMSGRSR